MLNQSYLPVDDFGDKALFKDMIVVDVYEKKAADGGYVVGVNMCYTANVIIKYHDRIDLLHSTNGDVDSFQSNGE